MRYTPTSQAIGLNSRPRGGDLINQFQINYHKFVTNMQRHESRAPQTSGKIRTHLSDAA